MKAALHLTTISLKLNFRNRMAILYGYLFPLIFLVAFWAVYRNDPVPLALHVSQFLTITILGSACFGLPTTIVSERERGVWRRYALMPARHWVFVVAILGARAVLLLTAAPVATGAGFGLWLAFSGAPRRSVYRLRRGLGRLSRLRPRDRHAGGQCPRRCRRSTGQCILPCPC